MSIQNEIERIKFNISSAYDAVADKGGELPEKMNSDNLADAIQMIPSGEKLFTIDQSLNLSEQNVLSVTTPVKKIITQEDFDALPDDEKNKGLYVIPGDENSASLGEVYSEDEVRIGTWVDGKPLYRKCFLVENLSIAINVWTKFSESPVDYGDVIRITGSFKYKTETYNVPTTSTSSGLLSYGVLPKYGGICLFTTNQDFVREAHHFICIIEYTKTTDSPKSEEAST